MIANWSLSDHSASWSDITDVGLTCQYRDDNRLWKVASQMIDMCYKSNVNIVDIKEFLLLGDKPDGREYHLPQCKHPS